MLATLSPSLLSGRRSFDDVEELAFQVGELEEVLFGLLRRCLPTAQGKEAVAEDKMTHKSSHTEDRNRRRITPGLKRKKNLFQISSFSSLRFSSFK
jgi:hypothetical protein